MTSWLETLGVFARPPDLRPRRAVDDEIRAEIEFHLEMKSDELVRGGLSREAANAEARRRFGDRAAIEKACRYAQIGERIMLQRIQVGVLVLVAAAVVALFWQSGRAQERYERTIDALRSDIAAMVRVEERVARASDGSLATDERTVERAALRTDRVGVIEVAELRASNWAARLSSTDDWRPALEIGDEIARLAPIRATASLTALWPQVRSPEQRRQLLKPFVLRDLHANALDVLDLAARDDDVSVQNRAFYYLRSLAFRDFAADPAAYAAWRERVEGRPLGEVLVAGARDFARSIAGLDGAAIEAAMKAADLDQLRYCAEDGDVAAALRNDGFVETVAGWVDRDDDASARAAATWLSLLQPEFARLRKWLEGDARHRAVALDVLGRASYVTSTEIVRELLHSTNHEERSIGRRRLSSCDLDESLVHEELLPLIVDPAQLDRETLEEVVPALGNPRFPCAVDLLVHLLLAPDGAASRGSDLERRTRVADALVRGGDARAIPALIALLVLDRSVEGTWQERLSALTGVADVPGHDADFWQQWWGDNRGRYPADARDLEIPIAAAAAFAQDGKGTKIPKDAKGADYEVADDVKDVPARELHAQEDEKKRYFLIGPREKEKAPAAGYALLLVLPGGTGEAGMTSFVRRIWQECCPKDWIVAQLVSVKWSGEDVTWPTRHTRVANMKFTTEEFVDAVLADVGKTQKLKIDPERIYQLGWSSGGPAEYAISLQEKSPVTASYVAMSVFREAELEKELKNAKGHAYFLDHSPEDAICKFALAQKAQERLKKEGALVELVTYAGGHGWNDDPYARLKKGFAWMEKNHAKPERK